MEINNLDKLVKIVTNNILDKIDYKPDSITNGKSCLILIPNMSFGFRLYLEFIMQKFPSYNLYVGSNEELSKAHLAEDKKNIQYIQFDLKDKQFLNMLDSVENIIVLGLKINQMKALQKTDDTEDINHIIIGSLMANKSVHIMINANELIFNKIEDIVYDIRNMGINLENMHQCNLSPVTKVDLISERYVESLKGKGLKVLILDRKQVITPLAKDKLRELKIKIEYSKEGK